MIEIAKWIATALAGIILLRGLYIFLFKDTTNTRNFKRLKWLLPLVVILWGASALLPSDFERATIARVIDGDTVVLENGERVRLIGVNTPEKNEAFGSEATAFTRERLEGETVWLQKDISDRDRYDRLLRYIWLERPLNPASEDEIREKMFNAILVIEGYAQPSTYRPDVALSEFFRELAREARSRGAGLWGLNPDGVTKGDALD